MLKTAVITNYFPTREQRWRGHSAYQTLRELSKHTTIEVFFPHPSYPRHLKPKSRIYDSLDTSFSPPDVKAHYIDYPALPGVSRPVNGVTAAKWLLPYVRKFNPDIVLSYVLYPDGYAAHVIAKKLGIPVVLTAIGSDLHRAGGLIPEILTRKALRNSDFVLTVSQDLLARAIGKGSRPARSRAILNGCDLSIFHPLDRRAARQVLQIDSNAEMVLFVGRLDLKKGLMELVDAAALVHRRRPQLRVYMVGDGPDKAALQSRIARHDAEHYVTISPACLTTQVPVWMASANVVVLPSYREGCPNVVLEALAMGRPVIATRVGGIPEIMDNESGRLIPPADVCSLTEALEAVLETTWDEAAISRQCSRSWEDVASEVSEVCMLLSGPQGRKAANHPQKAGDLHVGAGVHAREWKLRWKRV